MSPVRSNVGQPQRPSRRAGLTLIELLVILAIIAILVALMMPVGTTDRAPTRRTQCKLNLKQIGLALYNYTDAYGSLPPAYSVDGEGKPLHSWRTLILPFIDQTPLYNQLDLSKPWDDPENLAVFDTANAWNYGCPSANLGRNMTTYMAIVGEGDCFHPTRGRKLSEIKDGLAETIMVVEVRPEDAVLWMEPRDTDAEFLRTLAENTKFSHEHGIHALLADGAVRFFSMEEPVENLAGMATIDGHLDSSE
ncbi:MAG: DUF1559 domain-containing protein [Planctomycetaceae bacterium]|nr:DUF1559 domain-containing protein [Planctomycetaceae bacterium]